MLVYVAGLYTQRTETTVDENIKAASRIAAELWDRGYYVICPQANTAHFEDICVVADYDEFMAGCLDMLSRCDALVLMPNWVYSNGARAERDYALLVGIPVYEYPDLPVISPVEKLYPNQVDGFMAIIMKLYRLHLTKNRDYGPGNILLTGEVGLITRLWDKVGRLLNLYGFRFEIEKPGVIERQREPNHESVEDTFVDAAVYSIIGLLLRAGKWGR